ncbi:MAG: ScnB-like protein [Rhodospirillaceae bacterium]|nr:ScnB-like protein [Rhodospirillaceae bacterium]
MGGLEAGSVDANDHNHAPWEKKIDAIRNLLSKQNYFSVDELRRAIETLGPGVYDNLNYYERWTAAVTRLLQEKGVITTDELGRMMATVEREWREVRKS